jgi:S-adenosylmethionine decarboxylase
MSYNDFHSPGKHILLDFWGISKDLELDFVENALKKTANICGANILEIKLHSFGKNNGITGVVILEESHISIHTWPEMDFCAIDVFMCGKCDATDAIAPLKEIFNPNKIKIKEYLRGH